MAGSGGEPGGIAEGEEVGDAGEILGGIEEVQGFAGEFEDGRGVGFATDAGEPFSGGDLAAERAAAGVAPGQFGPARVMLPGAVQGFLGAGVPVGDAGRVGRRVPPAVPLGDHGRPAGVACVVRVERVEMEAGEFLVGTGQRDGVGAGSGPFQNPVPGRAGGRVATPVGVGAEGGGDGVDPGQFGVVEGREGTRILGAGGGGEDEQLADERGGAMILALGEVPDRGAEGGDVPVVERVGETRLGGQVAGGGQVDLAPAAAGGERFDRVGGGVERGVAHRGPSRAVTSPKAR